MARSVEQGGEGRTIGSAVGALVRLRREQRGLSAAELARRAGISKAALSGLESGKGNPTLDTLDALAGALAIPLVDLLDLTSGVEAVFVPAPDEDPADTAISSRRLVHRLSGGHGLELWRLRMAAGEEFDGVPHAEGTVEQVFVLHGSVTVTRGDAVDVLSEGDFLAFPGDRPHRYAAGAAGLIALDLLATPRA